jgi:hypothetical protein
MGVEHHCNEVMQYEFDKTMPPNIVGCFLASQVYYAHTFNKPVECFLTESRKYFASLKLSRENILLIFQFIRQMSQALLLTGQFEEASCYIEEAIKKRANYNFGDIDQGTLEAIDLFNVYLKTYSSETIIAKQLLATISVNNFYFLHKRYMTILYLSIKLSLQKSMYDLEQMQNLIKETGFNKLQKYCGNHF